MRPLTGAELARLSGRKGVAPAASNFLASVHVNLTAADAFANSRADAKSYRWNAATVRAVADGIALSAKKVAS